MKHLPFDLKINFYTMYMLIKRLWKKNKQSTPEKQGKDVLFSVAINNYPNPNNNLRGCLQDQENMKQLFANYMHVCLKDSEATISKITKHLNAIITFAKPGDRIVFHYSGHGTQVLDKNGDEKDGYDEALYVYDGCLIDDVLFKILSYLPEGVNCLVLLDSCHSESATRNLKSNKSIKINTISTNKRRKAFLRRSAGMKWTVISGCEENSTSADAFIENKYCGALSYFLKQTAMEGQTVKEWFNKLNRSKVRNYQNPTLEGVGLSDIFY